MSNRRHIRLITSSAAQEAVEDRRWLLIQGFDPKGMLRRATWYKADGQALPNCHTDPYHRKLYRERGFTLKPPDTLYVPEAIARPVPKPRGGPTLARKVLQVLEGKRAWEGSPTQLLAPLHPEGPGRHQGVPSTAPTLSKELVRMRAALERAGVTVERG